MSQSATPQAVQRIFLYSGRTLNDPDAAISPEQVKGFYAAIYPELTNATVEPLAMSDGIMRYEFKRHVGVKG